MSNCGKMWMKKRKRSVIAKSWNVFCLSKRSFTGKCMVDNCLFCFFYVHKASDKVRTHQYSLFLRVNLFNSFMLKKRQNKQKKRKKTSLQEHTWKKLLKSDRKCKKISRTSHTTSSSRVKTSILQTSLISVQNV